VSDASPPDTITAQAVRKAYCEAAKQKHLLPPAPAACEAIASALSLYRNASVALKQLGTIKPDTAGQRRMQRAERVRAAIGTLLSDLPELATWAAAHIAPGTEHAESLSDLLTAAQHAAGLWPHLNGSLKRFDPRSRWHLTANCIAGIALGNWQHANPGHKIGKPKSEEQHMTRLMVALLKLAGYGDLSREQVAKHFSRDQFGRLAFAIIETLVVGCCYWPRSDRGLLPDFVRQLHTDFRRPNGTPH